MGSVKLTLADQVLIWSALALAGPHREEADTKLWRDIIVDVLPHVTRANPFIAKIAEAAAEAGTSSADDMLRLNCALKEFARWRAGLSYDAFAAKSEGA